ncbi:hypothetical protein BPC006_II2557 [Burkholderia pseudomallei BPC006]|nr:hypothetical protein BPC006_II2557 [Burkholderia pseudomallei BPC006]
MHRRAPLRAAAKFGRFRILPIFRCRAAPDERGRPTGGGEPRAAALRAQPIDRQSVLPASILRVAARHVAGEL